MIAATLVVFAVVTYVAPMAARRPPERLSTEQLDGRSPSSALLAAPRLRTGLDDTQVSPLPTGLSSGQLPGTAPPDTPGIATSPPTARPAVLTATMNVSDTRVSTGERLAYAVKVRNTGARTYSGAFTVNLHTPEGTLRCEEGADACVVPGEYDGSSKDPSDPHLNPPGITRAVTVKPGQTVELTRLVVVVVGIAGTVLHNHSHVDGVGGGDGSATVAPGQVGVATGPLSQRATAPDVTVER